MNTAWILVGALMLALGQTNLANSCAHAAQPAATASMTAPKNLTVAETAKLLAENKTIQVVDLRTAEEFKGGHLAGAVNVDFLAASFETKIASLDRTQPYLIYCASGRRSAKARERMAALGFPALYHLEKGFNAWSKAGLPVVK